MPGQKVRSVTCAVQIAKTAFALLSLSLGQNGTCERDIASFQLIEGYVAYSPTFLFTSFWKIFPWMGRSIKTGRFEKLLVSPCRSVVPVSTWRQQQVEQLWTEVRIHREHDGGKRSCHPQSHPHWELWVMTTHKSIRSKRRFSFQWLRCTFTFCSSAEFWFPLLRVHVSELEFFPGAMKLFYCCGETRVHHTNSIRNIRYQEYQEKCAIYNIVNILILSAIFEWSFIKKYNGLD